MGTSTHFSIRQQFSPKKRDFDHKNPPLRTYKAFHIIAIIDSLFHQATIWSKKKYRAFHIIALIYEGLVNILNFNIFFTFSHSWNFWQLYITNRNKCKNILAPIIFMIFTYVLTFFATLHLLNSYSK